MKLERKAKHVIAVGGGKGGVGKSVCSAALAFALSKKGKRTVLADFDLGAANLHTYLGLNAACTLTDFMHKKVESLEDAIVPTGFENLSFLSGGDYSFGAANPAHWMKLKVMRHIHAIDADFVILDLGAGTSYNVLDLFGTADKGIVVTVPEPGAVINAYAFLKGALFRKIHTVFGRHTKIGPVIDKMVNSGESHGTFGLHTFKEIIEKSDPDLTPLINEIGEWFKPLLLVNMTKGDDHQIIENLEGLCSRKLGVELQELASVPANRELSRYLMNMLDFFVSYRSADIMAGINRAADSLLGEINTEAAEERVFRTDFDDDILQGISKLIDGLDDMLFLTVSKELMKCRLFFKPLYVIKALVGMGVDDDLFFCPD
ncbi:MAG: P-loop NTPase [Proteobacteria bacterium]|nr:P-loop NTPase [Pseudomonadota bacterium]